MSFSSNNKGQLSHGKYQEVVKSKQKMQLDNEYDLESPRSKQKIQILPADIKNHNLMPNNKSKNQSQVGGRQNSQNQFIGAPSIEYKPYKKHVHDGSSRFERLKSKFNFILSAGRDPDEEVTVSYYSQSRGSSARRTQRSSSISIQSNKRLILVQEEQKNIVRQKKQEEVGQNRMQKQQIGKRENIKAEENQFLAESFVAKQERVTANQYLFFGQTDKKQNLKEANKQEKTNKFQNKENKTEEKINQIKIQKSQESQKHQQFEVRPIDRYEELQKNKETKVIFAEQHNPSVYDFQNLEKSQISHLNQEPREKSRANLSRSIDKDKSFKSKYTNNSKLLTQSLEKSKDNRPTVKQQVKKSDKNDGMEELLAQINKQEQSYKKEKSIDSKNNELTDRFQQISNERQHRFDATRKMKSSQDNHYDIFPRKNVEQRRVGSVATDRFQPEQEQSIASSHIKKRQAQTLNLKPRVNLISKKRNSDYELNSSDSPKQKPIYTQNTEPYRQFYKKQPSHLDLKKQLQNELMHDDTPVNKIDFKIELRKRLKTEADQKESKKFTAILKKRQEALAKKVRQQLQARPKQLFYDGSGGKLSKQESLKYMDREQIPSSQFNNHNSYVKKTNRQTQRTQLFPSIDQSNKPIGIRSPKTTVHDYQNLSPFKKSQQTIQYHPKQRLKSDHNSSYSEKVSFEGQSIYFNNPALLEPVGKVSYRNLNHYWKQTKSKNISAKEKFERLNKLLQQI